MPKKMKASKKMKKAPKKKAVSKPSKKVLAPPTPSLAVPPTEAVVGALIKKAKTRSFVTEQEILHVFPEVE